MRRSAAAAVLASGVVLVAGSGTAAAVIADPPGTFETPVVSSGRYDWGQAVIAASTGAGAVMLDGTVRTTADPSTPVPLDASDPRAIARALYGYQPAVVNDRYAVALERDSTTNDPVRLDWVDTSNGHTGTASAAGVDPYGLAGATNSAWVVNTTGGAGMVLRPFDGSPDVPFNPADMVRILAVGTAGIAYLGQDPVPDPADPSNTIPDYKIRLVSPDLATTSTLFDLGTALSPDALTAAMDRGAFAYADSSTGVVGYTYNGTPSSTTALSTATTCLNQLTVIPGAVGVRTCAGDQALQWIPGTSTAVDETPGLGAGSINGFSPWATTGADPAFTADIFTLNATHSADAAWGQWLPGATSPTLVQPTPNVSAKLTVAVGTNGRLLTTYSDATQNSRTRTAFIRSIGSSGTTLSLSLPRASSSVSDVFGLSGTWSAVPEWPSSTAKTQSLTIRHGSTATAAIGIGTGVRQVAQSGPYTAYIYGSDAVPARNGAVVGPNGALVAALPATTNLVAQDGSRTAYALADGSLWLRDESKPASSTNPRKIRSACDCWSLQLSSRWLVTSNGSTVKITDISSWTTRSVGTGTAYMSCTDLNGPVVTCMDLGSDTNSVYTLDVSSSTLAFTPLATPSVGFGSQVLGMAGHDVFWPGSVDPFEGYTTTAKIAPLPTARGNVGHPRLLGPWAAFGQVVSTGGPAWTPQWALSDAASAWTLTLRNSAGSTIKTWKGSALDGDLKGVSWNGRLASGAAAPIGTYRWTLTGSGPFGTPVAVTGSGLATGTITVIKQTRAAAKISAPGKVRAGTVATVTGTLVKYGTTTPIAHQAVTLWRKIGTGAWTQIASGSTSTKGTVAWKVTVSKTASYQVRHANNPYYSAATSPTIAIKT